MRSHLTGIPRVCVYCKNAFLADPGNVRKGRGVYCSLKCMHEHRTPNPEDRFWQGVGRKTDSGCILWRGGTRVKSYGVVTVGGSKGRKILAHRLAHELLIGPIPAGMEVCHHCDNPLCINPVHLFIGTHADNMADMKTKRRSAKGSLHGAAKLTEKIVIDARRQYALGNITQRELAKNLGVSQTRVSEFISRKTWTHI